MTILFRVRPKCLEYLSLVHENLFSEWWSREERDALRLDLDAAVTRSFSRDILSACLT